MSRSLREGRAWRPHPLIVPGWPAGLKAWLVFQERELCPSFGLLVWNKSESSLISEWKNQTDLAPRKPGFWCQLFARVAWETHTSCPAPRFLVLWDITQEKGSLWSHGKLSLCTVPQAGSSPFPSPNAPYLVWTSSWSRQHRMSKPVLDITLNE